MAGIDPLRLRQMRKAASHLPPASRRPLTAMSRRRAASPRPPPCAGCCYEWPDAASNCPERKAN